MSEHENPVRQIDKHQLPNRSSPNPEIPPVDQLLIHAQRVERSNRENPDFLADIEYGQKQAEQIRSAVEANQISPETADFIHGVDRAELKKEADRDPLTDLPNRRTTFARLDEELALAKRFHVPLSVVYLDLDHFKGVNDTYGHGIGDALLIHVADRLRSIIREYDIAGRIGGEEFAVILPHTDEKAARLIAERIREEVESSVTEALRQSIIQAAEDKKQAEEKAKEVTVTISGGVAQLPSDVDRSSDTVATRESLLRNADGRMYLAKHNGRNRIVGSEEEKMIREQPTQSTEQ